MERFLFWIVIALSGISFEAVWECAADFKAAGVAVPVRVPILVWVFNVEARLTFNPDEFVWEY